MAYMSKHWDFNQWPCDKNTIHIILNVPSLTDCKIPRGKYAKVRHKGQNDVDDLKIEMPCP